MTDNSWHNTAKTLLEQGKGIRETARLCGKAYSTVWGYANKLRSQFNYQLEAERPKILLLDVETAPTAAYVWGRWKQNVGLNQVVSEGYLLTYSAKWLGDEKIACNRIKEPENDKVIIEELATLIDQADLIVAHNLVKFDLPTIKTRMLYHGLPPLKPVRLVDTLKIAKQAFRFPSNSLDSIAKYLGLSRKETHSGFDLWVRCMHGENEAFEQMLSYNMQDVVVLEEVYNRLAPWYNQHPSVAVLYNDGLHHCPLCGSTDVAEIDKPSYTSVSEFAAFRCNCCGKVSRSKKNLLSKEAMQNTLINSSN